MCYLMAKEGLVFEKYVALYELEARHDVDLGSKNYVRPFIKMA